MTKFEEEFNYLIELSGKVLIGQVDAEAFEKNRIAFFEKYETDQQQVLPVVPECVAELIKDAKENKKTIRWCLYGNCKELYPQAAEWIGAVDDIEFTDKTWKQQELFVRAWLDGYTVEKQQLFYLKHIDMSKNDEQVDWYMSKAHRRVGHNSCEKRKLPIYDSFKFTQQEIDSMETGSYEQIEVTE